VSCPLAHSDGSYVLGALSPADRQAFEEHLGDCPGCARAVQQLAGLPGLLARVDPGVLEDPPAGERQEPVPPTLLPALVARVRRNRRRRTTTTLAAAAAAAAVVVVGALGMAGALGGRDAPGQAPPTATSAVPATPEPMHGLGGTSLTASVGLAPVAWGTRLDLTCSYAAGPRYERHPAERYALLVRTREGRLQQVATWRAVPGRTIRLTGATSSTRADIAAVEVRTAAGRPVLRLRGA